jgi:hypothetical protein
MVKRSTPETFVAVTLPVRERILLFCLASDTDWKRGGVIGDNVAPVRRPRRRGPLSGVVPTCRRRR